MTLMWINRPVDLYIIASTSFCGFDIRLPMSSLSFMTSLRSFSVGLMAVPHAKVRKKKKEMKRFKDLFMINT